MWCRACQQDVPGVVTSSQDRRVRCARCGQLLTGAGSDRTKLYAPHFRTPVQANRVDCDTSPDGGANSADSARSEFVALEDWDLQETVRHARQLVQRVTADPATNTARESGEQRPTSTIASPARPSGTLPWLILALGLGVFACGAALMGLSLAKDSTALWQLGLPMVLGGQLAVLFVVIWQLEVVWYSNRATFVALHAMDDQLRQLRLHPPHAQASEPAGKSFVRRLPDDVSPHVVLNDLRAQLDALSTRLNASKDAA